MITLNWSVKLWQKRQTISLSLWRFVHKLIYRFSSFDVHLTDTMPVLENGIEKKSSIFDKTICFQLMSWWGNIFLIRLSCWINIKRWPHANVRIYWKAKKFGKYLICYKIFRKYPLTQRIARRWKKKIKSRKKNAFFVLLDIQLNVNYSTSTLLDDSKSFEEDSLLSVLSEYFVYNSLSMTLWKIQKNKTQSAWCVYC